MELPKKLLEQLAVNTRPKIQGHMLVVMDKSIHEEHLSQPLQTNNKQFKIAVTFLTGYNGILKLTSKNNKFYFAKSISDEDGFVQILILKGAFEIKSLNNGIKRIIIEEEHYTEANSPFTIKTNFSTLASFIEISTIRTRYERAILYMKGPVISFVPDDSIRDLLGFNGTTIYEEYILSLNPVDILSFDNILLECYVAQGTNYRGKRSVIFHNFNMDVDPGYKNNEEFCGGVQWFMTESKDIVSSICFKFKKLKTVN